MSVGVVAVLIVLLLLLWFVWVVPQRRRQRRQVENLLRLIELLEPGDEIITAGGIHGTVRAVLGEEELLVEIAPGVDVRLDRRAVAAVDLPEEEAESREELETAAEAGEREPDEPSSDEDSGRPAGR